MTLRPIPFATIIQRLARELETRMDGGSVFELPVRKLYLGHPGLDLSVSHHGRRAATPLGPAAGPHTQLAQNIVVGWLAGCRIIELKTVQVKDELVIPRPCIDMATVGYNVEWSQELRLEESAAEYVKASMIIDLLRRGGLFALAPGADLTVFDLSVGYDLAGIRSATVGHFLDTMHDATALIDRSRSELPPELAHLRDLDFTREIAGSVTLSTFHGCPPGEIEAIARWLMEARRLDVTVKLNPTLLGKARVNEVLKDILGYHDIDVPDAAFSGDPSWQDVLGLVTRLRAAAAACGRGFGIKLTNTLVVKNHRGFFPASEPLMYLSGPPLHVIASELVQRFRDTFGATLPISFSAGIDRHNFPAAVALGLLPVTVCSDLLQPGGYGRAAGYLAELESRMLAVGASDIPAFIERAFDPAGTGDVITNARLHAAQALADPRYGARKNARAPRKLDRTLALFDCTNCDKCLTVCPNVAIFALDVLRGGRSTHQIGILAEACNDCGNCDVFCPEHGGPNLSKPRFHLSRADYEHARPRQGMVVLRTPSGPEVFGRIGLHETHVPSGDGTPIDSQEAADLRALAEGALAPKASSWITIAPEVAR